MCQLQRNEMYAKDALCIAAITVVNISNFRLICKGQIHASPPTHRPQSSLVVDEPFSILYINGPIRGVKVTLKR